MEGDSNFACLTYENILSKEELWNDKETAWLLGREFSLPGERDALLEAARSKFWFTYRRGFSPIGGTGPTSDSGWGCMLRCGQMMLAQTLSKLWLKENWKWRPDELQNSEYYKILRHFYDQRSSCYSIQQIAQMGVQEGKRVGEWFGPNTVAQVLKKLSAFDTDSNIAVYVAMDNTICTEDVENLCNRPKPAATDSGDKKVPDDCARSSTSQTVQSDACSSQDEPNTWRPLLLIIPLRLGLGEINPVYFENIKGCLMWKESVGIIGGKPNHAYYFIGYTDSDHLMFLDPHTTQLVTSLDKYGQVQISDDSSYHCDFLSRMAISHLDPSLAIGFLCKTKSEFTHLCDRAKALKITKDSLPLFGVVNSMPSCSVVESRIVSVSVHNRQQKRTGDAMTDENACLTLDSDEDLDDIDEEFEILEVS